MSQQLDVAAKAASYNVALQLLLRGSSFVLNGFILRFIQAELLGVVNLRLTLLYNTVLFLSREAFRKACLSQTTQEKKWRHVFNLLWCSLPLGLISSISLSCLWLSPLLKQPPTPGDPLAVAMFALSALTELTAEPLWVLGQAHQYIALKVFAEGLPQLLRCVIVVSGVLLAPHWGLTIFSTAQLAYSLGYVLIYYGYFSREMSSRSNHKLPTQSITQTLPGPDGAKKWFDSYLTHLSWSFFKQSLLKQILTDGERYVMTLFGVLNFAEQGVYDIINNLGSLAARFIFQPIEESFYVFFASTLYRGEPAERQKKESVQLAAETLSVLLTFVFLIALTILCFGYAYSHLALHLYGGRLLSDGGGPILLRWYCIYVLLLALNGVTECFVFATMSQEQVDRYNRMMLVFSLVFLTASYFLTKLLGSVGFILANCVNMAARIFYSCWCIHSFFVPTPHRPLYNAIPHRSTFLIFAAAFVITAVSEESFCCGHGWFYRLLHIFIGFICLSVVGAVVGLCEPHLLHFIVTHLPVKENRLTMSIINTYRRAGRLPPDSHSGASRLPPDSHSGAGRLPPDSHSGASRLPPDSHSGRKKLKRK